MNAVKTVFLMTLMMALFLFIGYYLGGNTGMTIALLFSLLINFGSFWFSDKIVLAMYRAKEVNRESAPKFYDMVERLAQQANLPMPKVYLINDPTPNAFATGRSPQKAAVAATTGILQGLSNDELEGVMAHELAHVKNRDTLISTIAATLVGSISYIAQMAGWAMMFGRSDDREGGGFGGLVLLILSPIMAMLLQMAISRSREFSADRGGAEITGNPLGLASALTKISRGNQMKPVNHSDPATAHMFIINPLAGGGISKLFSTHPPTEERIKRLQAMVR
ncbi:MAG: zinc metalloprotease HtpX [Ignavibacteriota bacterium]|nr:MAG: zinc metalloprotease HtpX [Chlorobiota bacterium]MBE7476689.1 zinc metalloprotease HtpX [Ignavibacteriales bacterium]MBL1122059.1 zinc metalloprotease HtpX [Ignavibacteriota bacterium]MCC7094681.1 zinc metalloprotease HtpX [Ignavibacteriaceae bacterium]MCE7856087.1 zinc metalloprotease HtpX [Ignavibacteria bacterium CHB3]MEB2296740.1 zinc metalloprotease HtpX [Ignavibacteria bacterium]